MFKHIEMFQLLSALLIGLVIYWSTIWLFRSVKRLYLLPAGPWGLPIVGFLPFMKEHNYLQFDQLSKKYGPVFSLKLGIHDVIVICDWSHLKEAFTNDCLLARPYTGFLPGIINTPSILQMSGNLWREHRRLSLHVLRDVGFGKTQMESLISEEIERFLATLENGQIDDLSKKLLPSVSNNISALLFGHTFDYNNPDKIVLDTSVDKFSRFFQLAGIGAFLPWLIKPLVALGKLKMDVISEALIDINNYARREIEQHKANQEEGKIIDYIDGYLQEQSRRQDDTFNEITLGRNVSAFFGAGSETVASTLNWAIMYLVKYPQYQEKIRTEIAGVIGYNRKPDYSDRSRMPFTLAFICEVHRIQSIIAVNLIRRATRDTKVGDHYITKDSLVIFNFWSIHHDPTLWDEPEKFNPSRFLDETTTKLIKPAYLVPFSSGKRSCPGEGLANVEIFLYIVKILQRFKVEAKPGTEVKFDAYFGLTRRPIEQPSLIFIKNSLN